MRSSSRLALIVVLAVIGGCATPPPTLPPDYGSVNPTARIDPTQFDEEDRAASCTDIDREIAVNSKAREQIEAKIKADHRGNQIMGYFFGALAPLIPVTKMNVAEKERYQALYKRKDELAALKRLKSCP